MRWLVLVAWLGAGCASFGHNYPEEAGPRYAGDGVVARAGAGDTLRVVSFNIRFSLRIDSALAVLQQDPELRGADIVLLQEMDEAGTKQLARGLGMSFVYYPASYRTQTGRDFGNAILSRWPLRDDRKIILPHLARLGRTQRTATGATVIVGGKPVRVYSAHLATVVNSSRNQRADQLLEILNDAALHERVIVGGDMNDPELGVVAQNMGYAWPTREGPRTAVVARLDHIFVRGLKLPAERASGTVENNRNASDHRPIWIRAIVF